MADKNKRIDKLALIKFRKRFVNKDIYSIAYLEFLKNVRDEQLLEKAPYKQFYNNYDLITKLSGVKHLQLLSKLNKNKTLSFYKRAFDFQYYTRIRDRQGEELIKSCIERKRVHNAAFYFTRTRSLRMFFNFMAINPSRFVDNSDHNSSTVIQERPNKKVYMQLESHHVPQYIVVFNRKYAISEIKPIFERLHALRFNGYLGHNTDLVNLCFLIVVYYYIFIISIIAQIVFSIDFLLGELIKTKRT